METQSVQEAALAILQVSTLSNGVAEFHTIRDSYPK